MHDNKVAIALLEFPLAAYDHIEQSIFSKVPPGVTVQKREMFPFANGIGFLLTGEIKADGTTVHKWFLLAREVGGPNFDLTAFVTVDVPETARGIYTDAVVRAALASVTFRPPPLAEQIASLPFKFNDLAGFHVMQAMAEGGVTSRGPRDNISRPALHDHFHRTQPAHRAERSRHDGARPAIVGALRELWITGTEAMRSAACPATKSAPRPRVCTANRSNWCDGYVRQQRLFAHCRRAGPRGGGTCLFNRFRAVRDGIAFR